MSSCAKCGRQNLPKRKSDGARVCKRCGIAISGSRHLDRAGNRTMASAGFNQDDTETFLASKDFQISNAIWSIEAEFARFMKMARENITSETDDIHWLRVKLKEWDAQLSLLDSKVAL